MGACAGWGRGWVGSGCERKSKRAWLRRRPCGEAGGESKSCARRWERLHANGSHLYIHRPVGRGEQGRQHGALRGPHTRHSVPPHTAQRRGVHGHTAAHTHRIGPQDTHARRALHVYWHQLGGWVGGVGRLGLRGRYNEHNTAQHTQRLLPKPAPGLHRHQHRLPGGHNGHCGAVAGHQRHRSHVRQQRGGGREALKRRERVEGPRQRVGVHVGRVATGGLGAGIGQG
jgi:hypothetical protein